MNNQRTPKEPQEMHGFRAASKWNRQLKASSLFLASENSYSDAKFYSLLLKYEPEITEPIDVNYN